MRHLLIVVATFLVVILSFWQYQGMVYSVSPPEKNSQIPTPPEEKTLYPDLVIQKPRELFITFEEGLRLIRFSTTFINIGKGPLELVAQHIAESEQTRVTQKIIKTNGTQDKVEVGRFVFHAEHDHWHIEDYVEFQLLTVSNNLPGDLLSTTGKMSFCIWDEEAFDLNLDNAPQEAQFIGCTNETQGISVGWSDTYKARVEGQELDITGIENDIYFLRYLINPNQKISESDYSNNELLIKIEISDNNIRTIDEEI